MRIVYGVQHIEVEFGQRCEGWALFADSDECVKRTKQASKDGVYDGGYLGPERPLHYYEIPFDSLEEHMQTAIDEMGYSGTRNNWQPKFRGRRVAIK